MKKQNIRTLALIISTFTYLLIGAAVFDSFESEHEKDEKTRLMRAEEQFKRKYNISDDDYRNLSKNVILSEPHKAGIQWKFAGSFFFATTVITTIGYGHSAPKTVGGKIFCMLYALAGIPLNLVMFQSIGERLNIFVTYILRNIKKCLRFKNPEVSQTHLIIISMNMSSLVVVGGAWVFSRCEGWVYLDSFYYCIVTLTTVGFGDYVVLQQDNVLQQRPEYVVFSILFILFGLAVVSAAMNLLVLRFLTMNTVDERRDELQAAVAMRTSAKLDGDIITVNGSVLSGLHTPMLRHNIDLSIDIPALNPSSSSTRVNHVNDASPIVQRAFLFRPCFCCCFQSPSRNGVSHTTQERLKADDPDTGLANKRRYKVTRSPVNKVSHLLPTHLLLQDYRNETRDGRKVSLCGDTNTKDHNYGDCENGGMKKLEDGDAEFWGRPDIALDNHCCCGDDDEDDDADACRDLFLKSSSSQKRISI